MCISQDFLGIECYTYIYFTLQVEISTVLSTFLFAKIEGKKKYQVAAFVAKAAATANSKSLIKHPSFRNHLALISWHG